MRFSVVLAMVLICIRTGLGQSDWSLKGQIKAITGHPIVNAVVVLHSSKEVKIATSGRDGGFQFVSLTGGDYGLDVMANGFHDVTLDSVVIPAKDNQPVAITMKVASPLYQCTKDRASYGEGSEEKGGVVRGRVWDGQSSITEAKVALFRADNPVAVDIQRTGTTGEFWFEGLAPGKYSVRVSREPYEDYEYQSFWVVSGMETQITVGMITKGTIIACQ